MMELRPQPLSAMSAAALRSVRYVFTDFDDTLTLHGRLPAVTLNALQALEKAGIKVIPVTGGCAGWSDMMVRVLPVAGVISEGGGVFLQPKGRSVAYHFFQDEAAMRAKQAELLAMLQPRLKRFEALKLTRDQAYRLTDVAVDYAQEIAPPAVQEKDALLAELLGAGLNAKASSIHINICQDGVDKYAMTERVLREFFNVSAAVAKQQVLYVGDAPNDESMFAQFPLSVGVANIAKHLPALKHTPAFITESEGGGGFAELAEKLL
ncbi:HAD family hydrolase [Marinomonas fungiae]|uniref:HAD-superfamily hydrolase, subfamily IIB n=1 Tax=Marinomonas fungiae TaxID=1137284 RepID=A0A0K6INF4_9GAMM|nr:HAD-IIB family hydrolase [Marinomonas fungiae]CUB04616.1 HAD-superfamily hydrolase, subfamily IIB [Marinomonas fungiae]